AGALLVYAVVGVARSIAAGTFDVDIIDALDRLLLILLVVELLYTVQVSFREHTVVPEPFLLIGLIAVIRRVLVVTAEIGRASAQAPETVTPLIWELGVLAVLVLAISLALGILRRGRSGPVAERA